MAMGIYTIKDLEGLSGIKAHTIRIWEKRYGIINPARTDTNRRIYNDDDLRKLINVSVLNKNGFKISKIASLTDKQLHEKVSLLSRDVKRTDAQIESLIITMINLDEQSFDALITRSIINTGFEKAFTDIVFPFLRRVGTLWLTGSITPAQEHFVSNLIRQKLISTIDAQPADRKTDARKVLLFLPENELHEIGILFYNYLSRREGHEVLYLGAHTPLASVELSAEIWAADIIVTDVSSYRSEADEYLKSLSAIFPEKMIIIRGLTAETIKSELPANIFRADSADDYIRLLNK